MVDEPLRGIHLYLFKGTNNEQEYLFWYHRVKHLKDEIDFKIIDCVNDDEVKEKLSFHADRLCRSGYQIINAKGSPYRIKIYKELMNSLEDLCRDISQIINSENADSFVYDTENYRTCNVLYLLDELIIRAEPRIQIGLFYKFLIKLIKYTVIIKRHLGFSVRDLNDMLYKRDFDFQSFQQDLKVNLGRYIPDDFYEHMNQELLIKNIPFVQLVIRSETQIIGYFNARLTNSDFEGNRRIDSTKFFLINSFRLQGRETEMIELILYIRKLYNVAIYSEFRTLFKQSILIDDDTNGSGYAYLTEIWEELVRRFSHYESSKPNVSKARKERYDLLNENGFNLRRIKKDYALFQHSISQMRTR